MQENETVPGFIGEEVREQLGFLQLVGVAGGNPLGPLRELRLGGFHGCGQREIPEMKADDLGVEERFGFDCHGLCGSLGSGRTVGKRGLAVLIAVEITEALRLEILAKFGEIKVLVPFLINLSPQKRPVAGLG